MKYFLRVFSFFLPIFFITSMSYGQVTIKGKVVDENQEDLIGASVVLINPADSVLAAFSPTNSDGIFMLRRVKPGTYALQVSYVGYEPIEVEQVVTDEKLIELEPIVMKEMAEMLDGATITEERIAVRMKRDTVIYNADAFKTQENANVEDLLRKMPGIDVDKDGKITAQGEEVQEVLVDGKKFFGGDAKIATNNLPAKAIKEVQVFDKKSEQARFSGIDDGIANKTINLKLKDDYKKGAFGKVEAGYGTDERYRTALSLNSFAGDNQFSVLGQYNNINEQGFSFSDYIGFMGGMSNLSRGGVIRFGSNMPISDGLADGDTRSGGIGVNFNRQLNKNSRFNISYFYSDIDNATNTQFSRNYFLNNGGFDQLGNDFNDSNYKQHRISGSLQLEIDSMQEISFGTNLSLSDGDVLASSSTRSQDVVTASAINSSSANNTLDEETISGDASLTYRRKFKKKSRLLTTSLNYRINPSERTIFQENENAFFNEIEPKIENTDQRQFEDNANDKLDGSITWTEPLGKKRYIGLTYGYTRINNEANKEIYDREGGTMEKFNDELSNMYEQVTQYHKGELTYRWIFEKSNLNIRLGLQQSNLDGQILNRNIDVNETYVDFLPNLEYKYDFSRSKGITFAYETYVTQPTLQQLQPNIDNSNPIKLYVGNPDLDPAYTHTLRLRFRNWSQFNNTSLYSSASFSVVEDAIITSTNIDEELRQLRRPVNVGDNTIRGRFYINYGMPLRFMKARINVNANSRYNNQYTLLNDIASETDRWTNGVGLSLSNSKGEFIDWDLGVDHEWSVTNYVDRNDQKYSSQIVWLSLDKDIRAWSFGSELSYTFYDDNFSSPESVPLLEAYVSRLFLAKKVEARLTAFDILNENRGFRQSANTNYVEETISNTIGQYFMFSIRYNIGEFKNENSFHVTGRRRRR